MWSSFASHRTSHTHYNHQTWRCLNPSNISSSSHYLRYHFPRKILKVELSKAGIHPFNLNAVDPAKMKPSEFYQQQGSSSGSSSAETSSVQVAVTPSYVVSSLDTTPCSSGSSVIPEPSISNSFQLSEKSVAVPCSSTQSPPSTPVSFASNSGRGTHIINPLVVAGLVTSYLTALFLLQKMTLWTNL